MDFHLNHTLSGGSPSSSTSSSSHHHHHHHHHQNNGHTTPTTTSFTTDPMQSWWESISKARSRIHLLSTILPLDSLSSLADSDRPARSLLSSSSAYSSISSCLSSPSSGSGDDPLCHWLYDTFLSSDPDLRLVVLSFVPLLTSLYLSRIHSISPSSTPSSPSLSGFEAVLLSLYSSETKSRAGKPVLISIPDLSLPSLYHTPRNSLITPNKSNPNPNPIPNKSPSIGVICPPLEPQIAVKSTKRACIVGVALDCYFKQISQMPNWSKLDFCRFAADWAGQDCPCKSEFDHITTDLTIVENSSPFSDNSGGYDTNDVVEEMRSLEIREGSGELGVKGGRIPLPWEMLQPVLRIVGHCLLGPLNLEDVKDAASVAVRCLYARASHDLVPQAILATKSLIQLDNRAREAAKVAAAASAAAANAGSNANTPSKAKKPEILLVSK